ILVVTAAFAAALLLSPVSAFAMPSAALALLFAALIDRSAGMSTAIAVAVVTAALMPFDAAVALVLIAQGVGAVLARPKLRKRRGFLVSGLAAAVAGGAAYAAT